VAERIDLIIADSVTALSQIRGGNQSLRRNF
jgi:hypothetical protein